MCGHWSLGINRLSPIAAAAKAVAAIVKELVEESLQSNAIISVIKHMYEPNTHLILVGQRYTLFLPHPSKHTFHHQD